ncbi:MAG TPA: PQQ-binding-like beta-propeller repeat protein [Vicinamibacterales bacterium]|nr:PQQ-binding-like beta-propeller repeat protein [Vicinamibacterales bacterium]
MVAGLHDPLIVNHGGREQLVSVGAHHAAAYEPGTGKEIWRVSYRDGFSNVPRPVYGHGLVYLTTGFQQPSLLAVRPDGTVDVTRTQVAWSTNRPVPLTPSPLLVGDELYLVTDTGILSCVEATTGAVIWQQRLQGTFSASPVFADGRIYLHAEDGATIVIAPGRTFQLLAVNQLPGATLASMAVAGDHCSSAPPSICSEWRKPENDLGFDDVSAPAGPRWGRRVMRGEPAGARQR